MARTISTAIVPKQEYAAYRAKALQFFTVMKLCLQDQEWDAVLLNGVHAAISMNDALTVFRLGQRSASKSHQDATILLSHVVAKEKHGKQQVAHLSRILNYKNLVEYEPRRFSAREAVEFAKQVDRFFTWVQELLP